MKLKRNLWLATAMLMAVCSSTFTSCDNDDDDTLPTQQEDKYGNHDFVDLGLSVKWATSNLGASADNEYGDYFAWGETTPKKSFSKANYTLFTSSGELIKKYEHEHDSIHAGVTLEAADDAATANWGNGWRMPTEKEFRELMMSCDWTWVDGVEVDTVICEGVPYENVNLKTYGLKGVSKVNGNSIFLPLGGCRRDSILTDDLFKGCYQVSSLGEFCDNMVVSTHGCSIVYGQPEIYYGLNVRAVTAK